MVQAGLGHRRVKLLRQLTEGQLRILQPQGRRQLELVRQLVQEARPLELPDRFQLFLGRLHRLVQIGAVAVEAAVNAVAQVLFQLGGHDAHGGHGRTDQRQEVLDLVALLEVGDEAAVAPISASAWSPNIWPAMEVSARL